MEESNAKSTSDDDSFDIEKIPLDDSVPAEESMNIFLQELEEKIQKLKSSNSWEIRQHYQNTIKSLPSSTKPTSIEDALLKSCCGKDCCLKFTPAFMMSTRQLIPTIYSKKESAYEIIKKFQFMLIQLCIVGETFAVKVNDKIICDEFFRRLYLIPKYRFDAIRQEISEGATSSIPHGNSGLIKERDTTLLRFAKLISTIETMSEPHPNGKSQLMPHGLTQAELIRNTSFNINIHLNPTQEVKRIGRRHFMFQKANSFTKCSTCVKLKIAINNNLLTSLERKQAEMFLKHHRINIKNDRRDYAIRKFVSQEERDTLLSIAHDGMSKCKSRWPHLLTHHLKSLIDILMMMCSLNIAVVHKKGTDTEQQLHCFWNIDQISGARANAVISQLFFTISHCEKVPTNIAIQLDNCGANKCYTLFGAFGLLLKWIPKLTKIYICTSEVGHTHNDVDQTFGILAQALEKEEVYCPQGYHRFVEKKLKGIVALL